MDYQRRFVDAIERLKSEERYRVFADIERDNRKPFADLGYKYHRLVSVNPPRHSRNRRIKLCQTMHATAGGLLVGL